MVVVEKVEGRRTLVVGVGSFRTGDRGDVTEETAAHLCEEYGFERVDADDGKLEDAQTDEGICGTEMSDGSICDRPATECPYH